MSLSARLKRIGLDTYLLMLIGTVVLATVLPVSGIGAVIVSQIAFYAVALLFFMYGAKLNSSAVVAGMANWRLQLLVFATTYIAFPIVGIVLASILSPWLEPSIVLGFLFLAVLPSTVQSSIAFTSMAQGNVPAAVCAASLSNLVGVLLTPALAALLFHTTGVGLNANAVVSIAIQILLPFALGQVARPWVGEWISRHKRVSLFVDRGSILLIVYSAFSAGVVAGIWQRVVLSTLTVMLLADMVLLAVVMVFAWFAGKSIGLPREDRMVMLFCGSTKSLASGIPIANILFVGQPIGLIVLPLMLFHQIQLVACAWLAKRYAARPARPEA